MRGGIVTGSESVPRAHRRGARWWKTFAAGALIAGMVSTLGVVTAAVTSVTPAAADDTTTLYPQNVCQPYVVPPDVNQVSIFAQGGAGAPGAGPGSPGGLGGADSATFDVESGSTLWIIVGGNAGVGGLNNGGGSTAHGGAGGTSQLGYGTFATSPDYGGGGGGASFVSTDNAHCGLSGASVNPNDVLLVAGGGGGGGDQSGVDGGAGGNGGGPDYSGQPGGSTGQNCFFLLGCSGGNNGGGAGTLSGAGGAGNCDTCGLEGGGTSLSAAPSGSGTSWNYAVGGGTIANNGLAGAGGGGWNGGGAGGITGDVQNTYGGGGGGSNYIASSGINPVTATASPQASGPLVTITPLDTRRLVLTTNGTGSGTVSGVDNLFNSVLSNCSGTCTIYPFLGQTVTLTATPSAGSPGSRFAGWTIDGGSTQCLNAQPALTCVVDMDHPHAVTATFNSQQTLDTTVDGVFGGQGGGAGGGTITTSPAGISCGSGCLLFDTGTVVTLHEAPNARSVFQGWDCDGAFSATTCVLTMTQQRSVHAAFQENVLTVDTDGSGGTVSSSPTGISCGANCSQSQFFPWGTTVTLTAQPAPGKTFEWIYGGCAENAGDDNPGDYSQPTCTVTMEGDVDVPIRFFSQQETLNVSNLGPDGGQGGVTSSPAGVLCQVSGCGTFDTGYGASTFDQFETVTLTAVPQTGTAVQNTVFAGWYGFCHYQGLGTNDVVATSCDPAPCQNGDSSITCVVTMAQAQYVTADFATIPSFTLTAYAYGDGGDSVSSDIGDVNPLDCGGDPLLCTYYAGTVVTLTAHGDSNTHFVGWTGACDINDANCQPAPCQNGDASLTCQVTMDSAVTAVAQFAANPIPQETLTVTINGNAQGSVLDGGAFNCTTATSPCTLSYNQGTVVNLEYTTNSTHGPAWTGPCTIDQANDNCQVTLNQATSITATFSLSTEPVSVTDTGGGTGTVGGYYSDSGVPTNTPDINGNVINCGSDCSGTFLNGGFVALTATPTGDSRFVGWSGMPGCGTYAECTFLVSGAPVAVTAEFELNTLSVSVAGNGGGTVTSGDSPQTIDCGTSCTANYPYDTVVTLQAAPSDPTTTTFTGWTGPCVIVQVGTDTDACQVTMAQSESVIATFVATVVVVDLTGTGASAGQVGGPGGTLIDCGQGNTECQTPLPPNTQITLTMGANLTGTSVTFDGWSGPCTGTGSCTFTPTAGTTVTVTASFTLHTNSLTVSTSGTGTGSVVSSPSGTINCGSSGTLCSANVPVDNTVSLDESASAGSYFVGWTGACTSSTTVCNVPMSQVQTVNAQFSVNPDVTLTVSPTGTGTGTVTSNVGGINCPGTCSATFPENTNVTLTFAPSTYSTLATNGSCSNTTSTTCQITLGASDVTVHPQFTAELEVVDVTPTASDFVGTGTVTSNPSGINCTYSAGGSGPSCEIVKPAGSTVTLTATPAASSEFAPNAWSGVTCTNGMDQADITGVCTFVLPYTPGTSLTPTVTFVHDPFNVTLNVIGAGSGSVSFTNAANQTVTCASECVASYPWNTTQFPSFTATPGTGSVLGAWSHISGSLLSCPNQQGGDGQLHPPNPCTLETAGHGNMTITATFNLAPETLTVNQSGSPHGNGTITSPTLGTGLSCTNFSFSNGLQCSAQNVPYGTSVVVTTTPDPSNSAFNGWSGPCTATGNSCVVTMTQNQAVEANMTLLPATLTVTWDGTGSPTGVSAFTGTSTTCLNQSGVDDNPCTIQTYDTQSVGIQYETNVSGGFVGQAPSVLAAATGCTPSGSSNNTEGACGLTMNGDTTVNLTFDPANPLTVTTSGSGSGTVTDGASPPAVDCISPSSAGNHIVGCTGAADATGSTTLTATPSSGSLFEGWSGNCTNPQPAATCVVTMDQPQTVNADFESAEQQLTVTEDGNGTGSVTSTDDPQTIDCGTGGTAPPCSASYAYGDTVTLTANPDPGQVFAGWSGACSGTGSCQVTMDQAQSVDATFNSDTLTVTTDGTGTGTVTSDLADITSNTIDCGSQGSYCSGNYNDGDVVTLTATPDPGSILAGWTGSCDNAQPAATCVVTMDQAQSVDATFTAINLTVTTDGTGTGTVASDLADVTSNTIDCGSQGSYCSGNYNYGDVVTLTATPDPGSILAGWTGSCDNPQPAATCVVTMDQAQSVDATFTAINLTVTTDGSGSGTVTSDLADVTSNTIDCGSQGSYCSGNYNEGDLVTLTATPDSGSVFAGWSGDCSGTGTCQVTMDQAHSVDATFIATTQLLDVEHTGSGAGSVSSLPAGISKCLGSCTASFTTGTAVTLTATPSKGSYFAGWEGACSNATGPCQVSMSVGQTVLADFEAVQVVAPATVSSRTASGERVVVSWSAVPGASRYQLLWSRTSGGPYTLVIGTPGTSWTSPKLAGGTPYYFVVRSVTPVGTSPNSSETAVTTNEPPAAPASVTASAVGDTRLRLTWQPVPGAARYVVYRGTATGGPYSAVAWPVGATWTDHSLAPDMPYYYVVSTVDYYNDVSAYSAEATATTLLPPAPTGLRAKAINPSTFRLSWNAVPGAHYLVLEGGTSGGPYNEIATTSYPFTSVGPLAATSYYFVVRAEVSGVPSPDSSEVAVQGAGATPSPPGSFTVSASADLPSGADLSWTAPSPGTGSVSVEYSITCNDQTQSTSTSCGTTTANSDYPEFGLNAGDSYTFTVTATGSNGLSTSETSSAVTIATDPAGFSVSASTQYLDSAAQISWSAPSDDGGGGNVSPLNYTITCDDQTANTSAACGTSSQTTDPQTVSGLNVGDSYTFTVTATNADGLSTSETSNAVTVATEPGGFTATASSGSDPSSIELSWTNGGDGADGNSSPLSYEIWCVDWSGTVTGSACAGLGTISGSSDLITGLNPGDTYSFTVYAINANGLLTQENSNRVAASPSVVIGSPTPGPENPDGSYTVGDVVNVSFVCTDGPYGPGLQSCVDQSDVSSPGTLDTSSPGTFTYTVYATDNNDVTVSASITYTVDAASS